VIAIIAILAAILFPVFAQAKAAAKATASLSNAKQEGLGVIMYSGDADDVLPLATFWRTGRDPLTFGAGLSFSTWAYVVAPYIKSAELLQDPLGPATPTSWNSRTLTMTSFPGYAFNYVWLSPYTGSGPAKMTAVSATQAAKPAETVMLANRGSKGDGDGSFWSFSFNGVDEPPLLQTTVETPDCWSIPQWCADGWGKGGWGAGVLDTNIPAGAETGGVSKRAQGSSVILWLDGHANKPKISALAAGTSYNPANTPDTTLINDPEKYVWDTN
jgi:type II secretory pathway pseudopilin PulG